MRPGQDTIVAAIADQWTGESCCCAVVLLCYLNGAPSRITGRLNRVGTVAPLNASLSDEQWNWHQINRIMRRDRYFVTE